MKRFKVMSENKKSFTIYTEENGKYFYQDCLWWEKGGYTVPQSKKKTNKKDFELMSKVGVEF